MEITQRMERIHQVFEGFGEKHTCAEWAKKLNLNRTTMWRYLFGKGLTIEQIANLRGIEYRSKTNQN